MENYDPNNNDNNNNATQVTGGIYENTMTTSIENSPITQSTNIYSNENILPTTDQSVTTSGDFAGQNTLSTENTDSSSTHSYVGSTSLLGSTSDSNTFVSSVPLSLSSSIIPIDSASSSVISSAPAISSIALKSSSSSPIIGSSSVSSNTNTLPQSVSKSQIESSPRSFTSVPATVTSGSYSISESLSQSGLSTSNSYSNSISSDSSKSISGVTESWNFLNPTSTKYNSTQTTGSSIISSTGINGLPYYTSIENGPKTINPFLSILNAFNRNTTYLTGSFTSKSSSSYRSYIPKISTTISSANITTSHNSKNSVLSTNDHSYKNTTVLQHTTSTSSTSQITDSISTLTTTSETQSYSYTQDISAIYYVYTQQYDVTDSTTSFTTGLPTTITVSKQPSQSQITTSFSIPQATITTNMSMFEKMLNGALDGSSSSNETESLPGHSNKVGTIVGSVVGSVGGVTIVVLLLLWFLRRKKHNFSHSQNDYGKSFSSEIHNRQGYNSTSIATHSSPYNEEIAIKTTRQVSNDIDTPPKFSVTNPFNNEFEIRRNRSGPPPVPQPRKNMNTLYGSDRQSWLGNSNMTHSQASSSFMSSSDSSFADDSTISSSSIRLGSRYDSPSNNLQNTNSHPQGFFREII
ncbi:hypothetical protein C6P45_003991 [Maudiozyma exigua]|uniref:Topoisomerase I damage affected protein 7 n=1 Tax=Maudiozyma exigua TaxID=34358 RepID=A0A9P6WCC4_MAUEX|nr:hypothetical protein C6P45_003991 [Kazachstania exigua]